MSFQVLILYFGQQKMTCSCYQYTVKPSIISNVFGNKLNYFLWNRCRKRFRNNEIPAF